MKLLTICLASLALALAISGTEARSRHRPHPRKQQEEPEPTPQPVQVEEPKPVQVEKIEPAQSEEAAINSEEKPRPARARKTPVICTANTAAATLSKPDQVPTKDEKEKVSFEVIEPASPESLEIEPIRENLNVENKPPKKLVKPKAKILPASSEESESVEDDEGSDDELKSIEEPAEPAPPKALTNSEIDDGSKAAESEEEKPKARRSKNNRKDIRKIERPYRRRVVFHSSDEE